MATVAAYKWEYGGAGTGLHFTITYNVSAGTFTVTSLEGSLDLNALWWNDGVADGQGVKLSKSDSALNMNGSGEDWDGMAKLSNPGLGSAGENKTSFISVGETATFTLASFGITGDFDVGGGGTLGVRATSVNGGDSIKLVDKEPEVIYEEEEQDDFPLWGQDISNITLVFKQDAGDTKPRLDPDGYYTVKIDVPSSLNDDLDNSIDAILAALVTTDPHITSSSDLLGVVIKGGIQTTQYYAYGSYNTNGTDADPLPSDLGFTLGGGSGNVNPTNAIDKSYTLGEDLFLPA